MPTTNRHHHYDAVIVGGRAAGSATAMLLARSGLDVLVVDRSQYGDDTTSTHALMRGGVIQLHRWGLLPAIVAAGTPPVRRTTFFIGADRIVIPIKSAHGIDYLYAPRRTVLDPLLADTAAAAGADVRFGTTVTGLVHGRGGRVTGIQGRDADGRSFTATADITIGADGMNSRVAQWVGAPVHRTATATAAFAYGYWDGLGADEYEFFFRREGTAGVIPTNDAQACVFVGTTPERFGTDFVERPMEAYLALLAVTAPELSERLALSKPPTQLRRFPGRPGHIRQPWGAGWALVGDAGYFKDPSTAHGLTDALRDAELLARAIVDGAGRPMEALAEYEATRNRLSEPFFTVTEAVAAMNWDTTEVGLLLLEVSAAMTDENEHLSGLDDRFTPPAPRALAS